MQREFCYCHRFSTEGEIAGSAKIAPRYVIRDACPTSSAFEVNVYLQELILSDVHCSVLCTDLTYNLRKNGNTFEVNVYLQELILKTKMQGWGYQ